MRPLRKAGKAPTWILWVFLACCVTVPGLFFWGTWYGTRFTDAELDETLRPEAKLHDRLHAITEITRRLEEGAPGMDQWAGRLVDVSRSDDVEVRVASAWAMHYDPCRQGFSERLKEMIGDPSVLVRRNAATSLAAGGDDAGLAVLRSMLESFAVPCPEAGEVESVVAVGEPVKAGGYLLGLGSPDQASREVRSPVPGVVKAVRVEVGQSLAKGDEIVVLGPDPNHALNAAKALLFVGTSEDLAILAQAADPRSGFSEAVRRQAAAARLAIESRTGR